MSGNPRTGGEKEYALCVQCNKFPAHECLWVVTKDDGREYRLRATLCEPHERTSADHMERLKEGRLP